MSFQFHAILLPSRFFVPNLFAVPSFVGVCSTVDALNKGLYVYFRLPFTNYGEAERKEKTSFQYHSALKFLCFYEDLEVENILRESLFTLI